MKIFSSLRTVGFVWWYTVFSFLVPHAVAFGQNFGIKGLYISAETMEQAEKLQGIITKSKEVGINLFVVDLYRTSPRFEKNLELIKDAGMDFVVRVVIFPGGALSHQIKESTEWQKKLALVTLAHSLGAKEVQLDYIRYSSKQVPSPQNAHDVLSVIQAFKDRAREVQMPLQIAVFGITSFKPVNTIGQNLPLFSTAVDTICPMVYPSHYEPFVPHSQQPYKTIADSLAALKQQFDNKMTFRLLPYIETFNYRYPLGTEQRKKYIAAEIQATIDQGAQGFIAWSANNLYSHLFAVLGNEAQYFPVSVVVPIAEVPPTAGIIPTPVVIPTP